MDTPPDVAATAHSYARLGLSVLPTGSNSKGPSFRALPGGRWRPLQEAVARPAEIDRWYTADPGAGVGIICGAVSSPTPGYYLTGLDLDDSEFSDWVEQHAGEALLAKTWTVRTGSGKLHIYLYSRAPVYSTVLTARSRKVADIRGEGHPGSLSGYLVAPPSQHPTTKQQYETMYGDPTRIARTNDAMQVFQSLLTRWSREGTAFQPLQGSSTPRASMRILPPGDDTTRTLLRQKIIRSSVPPRIRRSIESGAIPGDGEWPGAASHSEIDYGVVLSLLRCGFTPDDVEVIYASYPIGDPTYQNEQRPDHGLAYITLTITRAQEELARQQAATALAAGDNFTVEKVIRVEYEDNPVYLLALKFDTGVMAKVQVKPEDLQSERAFVTRVISDAGDVPDIPVQFRGRDFLKFGKLIVRMAEREAVPQDATVLGHLRTQIVAALKREILDRRPQERGEVHLGWIDKEAGYAFVIGPVLIARLAMAVRPAPRPDQVWQALRLYGGSERSVRFGTRKERVWAIPLSQLGDALERDTESQSESPQTGGLSDVG